MQPVDALRRIAYLLEAEGAETYKVQAFRRAAATVGELPPVELARLNDQGRLETLAGVGKSTAAVINEALSGSTPEYLEALEQRAAEPPAGSAGRLLQSLRGDCHSHSNWSDGGSPIDEMALTAVGLGHEYLVLTDHSPRLTVANGLSADDLRRQLDVVAKLNETLAPFRLLTGIEVDILEDGALDQEEDLLARLEVVVASVHSKLRMEKDRDDGADDRSRREPSCRHPRPLHRAPHYRPPAASVELRPRGCFCRLRGDRDGGGNQFTSRPPGPARRSASSGSGGRLPVFHRLRCSRPGPAFVAPAGLRASGPGRDLVGADCQYHAARPAAGLDDAPLAQSARLRHYAGRALLHACSAVRA